MRITEADYNRIDSQLKENQETMKKAQQAIIQMKNALDKIVATSHSWVMREETAKIEKPIHDKYREIAKEGLK